MITNDIIQFLEKSLKDADSLDDWHKYGEGYTGLRHDVETLIKKLKKEEK